MKQSKKEEFLQLLESVYSRLSRYALAVTRNKEEAEDLVSDAVLLALERFDTVTDADHFAGFIFKITSRLHKRRRYRDRFRIDYDHEMAEALEDHAPLPDRAAEIALVMAALDRLPAKMKETVVLFDVADLSLDEIRAIQGGTLSGVKSRLLRGREAIQKYLGIKQKSEESGFLALKHESLSPLLSGTGEYYAH
ncbi:MAG: RNA polymerase sigma factor [Bacteroidota bacterium]|nr:RNA polymerase sigma factor [Bacteroidota bacterium]MDP4230936.1 RNA polymerase sigma factor [Bacteroidota bacterium]MDP4237091.1 RNA polymerase sigma factor [Bacteroidota bacterium]